MKGLKINLISTILAGTFLLAAGCEDNNPLNKALSLLYIGSNSSVKECSVKVYPETITALSTKSSQEGSPIKETLKGTEISDDPSAIWTLFDSNTVSSYTTSKSHKFNINFEKTINLNRIKVFGNTSYTVNIYVGPADDMVKIPSLCVDQSILKNGSWNILNSDEPIKTNSIILEIIPDGDTGIYELEFWSEKSVNMADGSLNNNLENIITSESLNTAVKKISGHVFEKNALPNEVSISGTEEESAMAQMRISLSSNPVVYKRAYIKYKAKNILTPVSIERRINNLSWKGGFDIPTKEGTTPSKNWVEHFEEINPSWLVAGDNVIEFRTNKNDISIQELTLILVQDNGWNDVVAISKAEAYDNDETTSSEITDVNDKLDIEFERSIEPESVMISIAKKANAQASIQFLSNNQWFPIKSNWTIDLSEMNPGWNFITLPSQVQTKALRLQIIPNSQGIEASDKFKISEIRVCGSAIGDPNVQPRIIVSYPRNGEYYGRTAYIQGFVNSVYQAQIGIENNSFNSPVQDNSFSLSLSKDNTRFSSQEDDTAWSPVANAVRQEFSVTNTINLTNNKLSTSSGNSGGTTGGSTSGSTTGGNNGYTTEVFPDSTKTITFGPLTIEIPAGAVDEKITINIIPLAKNEVAQLNPGMINVTYPAAGYRFLVNGKAHYNFRKPINISFTYSKTLLLQGQGDSDVFMYYYNELQKTWKRLLRVNTSTSKISANTLSSSSSVISPLKSLQTSSGIGVVVSETDHFTDIINGTITVPENPDPLVYNPNSIKDLKVGDPGEGITIIEPPIANNTGEARFSYPIDIPKGRKGMQPQVSIIYNSNNENGWLGFGWDIPLRAITIDTKYGVPRYNGSEHFILEGMAIEMGPNGYYQTRVEGEFNKIIRNGNNPGNYSWEVIDKSGTRFIYGRDPECTLKNYRNPDGSIGANGNIFIWCLDSIIDSNGNIIKYEYQHDTVIPTSTGEPATQIYLRKVSYTGFNGSTGPYSVEFNLDDGLQRPDKIVNCRGGFKILTNRRLESIDVKFRDNIIRRYLLRYRQGQFQKSLLERIEQYGEGGNINSGNLFNSHSFEYFDDLVKDDETNGFGLIINALNNYILSFGEFDAYRLYDISTQISEDYGFEEQDYSGTDIHVGIPGADLGGIGNSTSTGNNHETMTMIDINGDNLIDQVFCLNGSIYYKRNRGQINGEIVFDQDPYEIPSLSKRITAISNGSTIGSSDRDGILLDVKRTTEGDFLTTTYFKDVNGDGLIDCINNGIVLYNRLNSGEPCFSEEKPNGFGSGTDNAIINSNINTISESEINNKYYRDDPIMMWEAPYDGVINISGNVRLIPKQQLKGVTSNYQYDDGVRVSVQKGRRVLWSIDINNGHYEPVVPESLNNIIVNAGDQIYFRVNSISDGVFDCVEWNPIIEYQDDLYQNLFDENNVPMFHYEPKADYSLAGINGGSLGLMKGRISINGTLVKNGVTSDDFVLKIVKKDRYNNIIDDVTRSISGNETGDIAIGLPYDADVETGDQIYCELISDTPIDWTKINFTPKIVYTDMQVNPSYVLDVPITIKTYPIHNIHPVYPVIVAANKAGKARIVYDMAPLSTVNPDMPDNYNATVVIAVKINGNLIRKEKATISNGIINSATIDFETVLNENDKIYFVCAADKYDFTRYIQLGSPVIYFDADTKHNLDGSITLIGTYAQANVYRTRETDHPFAGGFRSWYFGRWNGEIAILDPNKMAIPQINIPQDPNDENYQRAIDELKEQLKTFSPMILATNIVFNDSINETIWFGKDKGCFIGRVHNPTNYTNPPSVYDVFDPNKNIFVLSSTRIGRKNISNNNLNLTAGDCRGVNRIFKGSNIILENSTFGKEDINRDGKEEVIESDGDVFLQRDIIDINGDNYLDIIDYYGDGIKGVLFTNPNGSFENRKVDLGLDCIQQIHSRNTEDMFDVWIFHNDISGYYLYNPGTSSSIGINTSEQDLIDINGDGLPDIIFRNKETGVTYIKYNLGYRFSEQEIFDEHLNNFNINQISSKSSTNNDFSGPVDEWRGMYLSAISLFTVSTSENIKNLYDINGDRLPDMIEIISGNAYVRFNTGSGFAEQNTLWNENMKNIKLGASGTYSSGLNLCRPANALLSISGTKINNTTDKINVNDLIDINGDNNPDYIDSTSLTTIYINTTGKTNLLKRLINPLGGSCAIDYNRMGNTQDMPESRWVLSKVELNDGMGHIYNMNYDYISGHYDRNEREFYGFERIIETRPDNCTMTYDFYNKDYYLKGLEYKSELRNNSRLLFIVTRNNYQVQTISPQIRFPYLESKETEYHEGVENIAKTTTQAYSYDQYGNIIRFVDNGDNGEDDDLEAIVTYKIDTEKFILNKPNQIIITGGDGKKYRERSCTYDNNGNLCILRQLLSNGEIAVTNLTYNTFGNPTNVTGPSNHMGQRYSKNFKYDEDTQSHITSITDSFGYESRSEYTGHAIYYGKPSCTLDINNSPINYAYDAYGRVKEISIPYSDGQNDNASIRIIYNTSTTPAYSETKNIAYKNAGGSVTIKAFIDGLKRSIKMEKSASIGGRATTVKTDVIYDNMGRIWRETQPYETSASNYIEYTYDVLDRKKRIFYPDNTNIEYNYGFEDNYFYSSVIDQKGKVKKTINDVRGLIIYMKEGTGENIITRYSYNPMGEITGIIDANNNHTIINYDNLGRRTRINNSDSGIIEYAYDLTGNLIQKITPNLREQGKSIKYRYNYNRREQIVYPEKSMVTYIYGVPNDSDYSAGRIKKINSTDFREERKYDILGNISTLTRNIFVSVPLSEWKSYTMSYKFDAFGRMRQLVFQDHEMITYEYDAGGLLTKVIGSGVGNTTEYVKNIEYDENGQRTKIEYGNGIITNYSYNDRNKRLVNLRTVNNSKVYQNIIYEYDNVGNILKRSNENFIASGDKTVTSIQDYSYDDLDRLVESIGRYEGELGINSYTNSFTYNSIGNILSKIQVNEIELSGGAKNTIPETTYNYNYQYLSTKPHAVTSTGDLNYQYDLNGNMISRVSNSNQLLTMQMTWDEENRLIRTADSNNVTTYKYDDTGARIIKKGNISEVVYFNENFIGRNGDVQSKHVFAGNSRIVTKITSTKSDTGIYYYHSDHLGSSNVVTNNSGAYHENIEYFPYGETWVEGKASSSQGSLPYKFTSKELDTETGLYYYGARYYDSKLCKWISSDPAINIYFPNNITSDQNYLISKNDLSKLPGLGGVYNPINLNLYHFTNNNPVKFIDPDGNFWQYIGAALVFVIEQIYEVAMSPREFADGTMNPDSSIGDTDEQYARKLIFGKAVKVVSKEIVGVGFDKAKIANSARASTVGGKSFRVRQVENVEKILKKPSEEILSVVVEKTTDTLTQKQSRKSDKEKASSFLEDKVKSEILKEMEKRCQIQQQKQNYRSQRHHDEF